MFKSFQKGQQFKGFPNLNFQMNNEAYGFSGCTMWLDAAWGLNTQTDLGAVTTWRSRVGDVVMTQASVANQPRFNASNGLYNNYPTVESQGTGRCMSTASGINVGSTVAFVANYNTIGTLNNLFAPLNTGVGALWAVGLGGTATGVNGVFVRIATTSYVSATTESNSVKIVVITPNAIYVNGVLENSSVNQINNRSFGLLFLATTGSTGDTLNGYCAELIFWNTDYTGSELEISSRLNAKYAIY